MRTSWIGVGPPQEHRARVWSAGAAQLYWLRYKVVVQTDWTRLDAERVRLVSLFCDSKKLPGIEAVVRATTRHPRAVFLQVQY